MLNVEYIQDKRIHEINSINTIELCYKNVHTVQPIVNCKNHCRTSVNSSFSSVQQLNALYRTGCVLGSRYIIAEGKYSSLLMKLHKNPHNMKINIRIDGLVRDTRQIVAQSLWWYREGIGDALNSKDLLNTLIIDYNSLIMGTVFALYETIPQMIDVFLVEIIANVFLPSLHPTTHATNLRFLRKRISQACQLHHVGKKRPHSTI